jgi:hypothetical protein
LPQARLRSPGQAGGDPAKTPISNQPADPARQDLYGRSVQPLAADFGRCIVVRTVELLVEQKSRAFVEMAPDLFVRPS